MVKDYTVFLEHMIESIKHIEQYLDGKTRQDFLADTQLQDSVIRRIEIIGEASRNIPESVRDEYNQIPWREIACMRNLLIHQYFGVDLDLTWQVAAKDLPQLRKQVSAVLIQLGTL